MNVQRAMLPLACVILVAVFVSCSQPTEGTSEPVAEERPDIVVGREVLFEKARQIGESELAKLSAAEMIYRNKVYDHVYIDEDNGFRTDMIMKYFRNFRDFEVLDVKRSDSLLFPVTYVIKYNYDLVGTRGIDVPQIALLEGAKEAKLDHSLMVHATDSLVREYRCSGEGVWDAVAAELLPRPNWWELNPWAKKTGVLSVESLDGLGSF